MKKLTFDASGNLMIVENVRAKKAKAPEHVAGPHAHFSCDECKQPMKETDLNLCRKRSDTGMRSLVRYQICSECVILGQDKYIVDDVAPGIYFKARHLEVELKLL